MSQTAVSPKLQRLALTNVCLGQFMTALDSRSVIVALPTISVDFSSSMAVVQWIPLAYQLTIIGFVLSLARLGDMLGRKKIYGLGFLMLALGSVCCGLSTAAQALIAGKLDAAILGVQGLIVADKAGARVLVTAQEFNIFAPNGTLMATRSYIQRNRDAVMRFMRGFVEAVHFFKTQREKSVAIMTKYMGGFSPEVLSLLRADQTEDFQPLPIPQRDAIQAVLDRETDPKAKSFKPEEFMDASFLQEIERSGFRRTLYNN